MKDNKGFTFVEILASIVILGILLGLGITVTTRILDDSRKKIYLAAVNAQVEGIKLLIESEEYDVYDENTTYYFDYSVLKETDDIKSPYGDWKQAYVVVTYTNDKLNFYWTGIDVAGWRIDLGKKVEKLTKKDIYNKKTGFNAGNSLEGKDGITMVSVVDGEETIENDDPSNPMTKEDANKCFEYTLHDDNTCTITGYKKECGSVVNMPSTIDGSVITKIGAGAFRGKEITSVTLYKGLEEIGMGAFQGNSITSLKLSKSLKKIEDYAFYQNKIPEVSFPDGLISIGAYGFANNKLTRVILPESLKSIGVYAFANNLIREISFNSNPTIGGAAFSNNKVPSSEGIIYLYNSTTKQFDYTTIIGYCSDEKNLVIPEEVNGIKPTLIKSNAFSSAGLTSVMMPDSIIEIQSDAFAFNSISTLHISTSLKKIGNGAFRYNSLTSIDIPDTVTSLGNNAFNVNKLTGENAIIYARTSSGTDYTTIVSYAGGGVAGTVRIPAQSHGKTLKRIRASAFADSKLTAIELPNLSETPQLTIENNAFIRNNISGVDGFFYKVTNGSIDYTTLSSYAGPTGGVDGVITIPKTKNGYDLKSIQASFGWMSFTKIVVPESVTSITNQVFSHSNRDNVKFTTIVNKTNRSFNWYGITGSSVESPGNFVSGTVQHLSGNIEVVKG